MSVPISAMSRREALAGGGGRERLNSAAITAAIRPFTPQGAFGARHWHTRSTYARHRIRHGIRHTAALAGRDLRPCVANDRLRHMPIDSARASNTDGSQSLEVPAERGAVLRRATEEFEHRVSLSTLNDIRNFCEAYSGSRNRGRSPGRAGFQGSSSSS